jgi:hypothetical protein
MFTKVLGMALLLEAAMFAQMPANLASHGRPVTTPESFYIAGFYNDTWTIVDVQQSSASDSKVRFIQVYPACATYHVQEEDYVFENVSVQELAEGADICSSQEAVTGLVKPLQLKKDGGTWWADRQGIEAQCGSKKVIHHLPARESLRFAALKAKAPQTAALWTLSQEIRQRYKDIKGQDLSIQLPSPFPTNWRATRLKMRPLSEQAAIDIRAGSYDLATPEIPEHWQKDGQSRLSQVMPDPEEATSLEENLGTVENAGQLGLEESVGVPYPPLALMAHIEGDVSMEVYIDAESGSVMKTVPTSGHPVLRLSAGEAINKWTFFRPYSGRNPLSVVIHYQLDQVHCPLTIETMIHKADGKSHGLKKYQH